MKPFAFQFKEIPTKENLDYSLIEYDEQFNLSVIKTTRQPAIDTLTMDTETFTKAQGESSDSDDDGIRILMDTTTATYSPPVGKEDSDSDSERGNIQSLMDTTTITESREDVDQDR
ncbi:MAG TPA: hypothetical protein VE978_03985 [Chitinophagales bacterium]|nr:hypothetical protein [Chitinophagales bacterium]